MNFEGIGSKENSMRLILESIAEQLADEVECEILVLMNNAEMFIFQPYLIPENDSTQRIGPSENFVKKFVQNMVVRLEHMYPDVHWENGLTTNVSPEGIATVRVNYAELQG
jgi:hypothetical protein